MSDKSLLERYNYDEFVPDKFMPWMRFAESPELGAAAPDFPLWQLDDGAETSLKAWWSKHLYLVVEFGSFT